MQPWSLTTSPSILLLIFISVDNVHKRHSWVNLAFRPLVMFYIIYQWGQFSAKKYLYIILVPPFPFLPTTEKHFVFTFGLIRITQLTKKDHPLFSAIILQFVVLPTCIITKPESSHCEPCHSVTKKVN